MLEIRNVTKIYHSKAGNSVKALDNVSVTFPETGMVFVLGKSGSGKSTLLNVIGGLDGCDSGEFIIKGKSSADFAGSDFDAYRNTFIGFIFQEYNVLDDFSVGANIGLALELQGKKATNEKITGILEQVDMLDFAKRKPNELSGGQKQRVAIARALVKDPEIIMADEPTGALDSNTGKQILDTLKSLSKTKLVIIVSHDREFAERYGDRIIEMQDGRILSDVTKREVAAAHLSDGILKMSDSLLKIEKGYQLTAADVALINEYLRTQSADILVSGDKRLNDNVRSAAGISENNTSSVFNDTDEAKDVKLKEYKKEDSKFIRSRLPMKNAFKMGTSSLGHKKFRLVLTIFLSLIAFALFGFADTLGAYDKITAATDSIVDSHVQNASFTLGVKHTWTYGERESTSYQMSMLNDKDIAELAEKTGLDFVPVFSGQSDYYSSNGISVSDMMISDSDISSGSVYTGNLYGFACVGADKFNELNFPISGELPDEDDEIAITELIYRQFNHTGFANDEYKESVAAGQLTMNVDDPNSIIGKHITIEMVGDLEKTFVVTAVIDTAFDYGRYESYLPKDENVTGPVTEEESLVDLFMKRELNNTLTYGFHSLGYVSQSALESMAEYSMQFMGFNEIGTYMQWSAGIYSRENDDQAVMNLDRVVGSSALSSVGDITWFDGNARETLGENEIVVSSQLLNQINMSTDIKPKVNEVLTELYGGSLPEDSDKMGAAEIIRKISVDEYVNDTFASVKEELSASYRQMYGAEIVEDNELLVFFKECMEYNYEYLPEGCKTSEEVYSEACFEVVEKIFGNIFDEKMPYEFYSNVVSNTLNGSEEIYFSSRDAAKNIAIMEYVYNELYSNPDFYDTKEFFDVVISDFHGISYDEWTQYDGNNKRQMAISYYMEYIKHYSVEKGVNELGGKVGSDFDDEAMEIYTAVTGESMQSKLDDLYLSVRKWTNDGEETEDLIDYKIVGVFTSSNNFSMNYLAVSDSLYAAHDQFLDENGYGKQTVAPHDAGIYSFVIAPMPEDRDMIRSLVELNYDEGGDIKFELQNQVMDTLGSFNEFIEMGAKIFLYIGIGFAVFSALMLMNFISVSISYKRREIGILRAVGARSSDVFKIFFCEAFVIAIINYVLSLATTITATVVFNNLVRNQGITVTLLNFGIRQVLLMLAISIFVAAVSSFLPVWNIARRKPIDAIKNK